MDEHFQNRFTEIEQAVNRVSETIRYALIDEDSKLDGQVSVKLRLRWIQESVALQTRLMGSIHVAAWIIAITVVANVIHHW